MRFSHGEGEMLGVGSAGKVVFAGGSPRSQTFGRTAVLPWHRVVRRGRVVVASHAPADQVGSARPRNLVGFERFFLGAGQIGGDNRGDRGHESAGRIARPEVTVSEAVWWLKLGGAGKHNQ
jgi:hypothetical protein